MPQAFGQTDAELPEGGQPWPAFLDAVLAEQKVEDPDVIRRAMRPEAEVMRPERLRAAKASRLSATRRLVRRMTRAGWSIRMRVNEVTAKGSGLLIYDIEAEGFALSFVVWAAEPESEADRLGRFYEHVYDFYGSLLSGHVDLDHARREADQMRHNIWAGRTDNRSLGWTIANRSNRFFNHVVEALTAGRQPDVALLSTGGGYIVRNAGWYGNGRHGSRAWLSLPADGPFAEPYVLDLFSLYLWRTVSADVAETIAARRRADAVPLGDHVRRFLGIGNSSGIGMVAALVRWPTWLATYNLLREAVRAYVVTRPRADAGELDRFLRLLDRAARYYAQQPPQTVAEAEQPAAIASRLAQLHAELSADRAVIDATKRPWAEVARRAAALGSAEVEEQVTAVLIETAPDFTDAVSARMREAMATPRAVDPAMPCGALLAILRDRYGWALEIDFAAPGAAEHFWYKSEENGENRRGERAVDPGVENETFVNVAGAAQELERLVAKAGPEQPVGMFLLDHPDQAHMVSRAQLAARMPYTEIRSNIIHRDFLPMDGIRLLLSVFGLEASAPYSTRWVRGVFLQGAPLPTELDRLPAPDWMYPVVEATE